YVAQAPTSSPAVSGEGETPIPEGETQQGPPDAGDGATPPGASIPGKLSLELPARLAGRAAATPAMAGLAHLLQGPAIGQATVLHPPGCAEPAICPHTNALTRLRVHPRSRGLYELRLASGVPMLGMQQWQMDLAGWRSVDAQPADDQVDEKPEPLEVTLLDLPDGFHAN